MPSLDFHQKTFAQDMPKDTHSPCNPRRPGSIHFIPLYIDINFFDCWWALFGNRAAENNNEGHSVY